MTQGQQRGYDKKGTHSYDKAKVCTKNSKLKKKGMFHDMKTLYKNQCLINSCFLQFMIFCCCCKVDNKVGMKNKSKD